MPYEHFQGAGHTVSRLAKRATLLAAAVAAVPLLVACGEPPERTGAPESPGMTDFLDFATLERPDSPNHWLVGSRLPADAPAADAPAPTFDVPAAQLAAAWVGVVQRQPRTRILGVSEDGLQVEAEQRSAVFRFVDRVSFRAVALSSGRSSFLAYSRAQVGYWDLGVNRRRLDDWVGALRRTLQGASS